MWVATTARMPTARSRAVVSSRGQPAALLEGLELGDGVQVPVAGQAAEQLARAGPSTRRSSSESPPRETNVLVGVHVAAAEHVAKMAATDEACSPDGGVEAVADRPPGAQQRS